MWQWFLQVGYNVLFVSIFILSWPYFTWRLRKRGHLWRDFGPRLGLYTKVQKKKLRPGADLWIHAVSVGEVMIASVLIYHLRQHRAQLRLVLTCTTATGFKLAQTLENELTTVLYNPTDFYWGVLSAFHHIKPKLLVLIESEIWPNYLWTAKRRGIPVYLVNARLSPRTEARYRMLRWFIRPVLKHLDLVCAQHSSDIERLVGAGFPPETIFTLGSLKYDVADLPEQNSKDISTWWGFTGWTKDHIILLGGSTHPGEEEVLVKIFNELIRDYPLLRLVLVPRHAERGTAILEMCQLQFQLRAILRTDLTEPRTNGTTPHIMIINSTGELRSLYREADLVFVGKSLRSKGGQNFIEAARAGCATLVGPNMQNFEHLLHEFLSKNGVEQVVDEFELTHRLRLLLESPVQRTALGQCAEHVFSDNLGAGARTADLILKRLSLGNP
jgi:3-deoxy-D-manno-octulosonic-acid transferase